MEVNLRRTRLLDSCYFFSELSCPDLLLWQKIQTGRKKAWFGFVLQVWTKSSLNT